MKFLAFLEGERATFADLQQAWCPRVQKCPEFCQFTIIGKERTEYQTKTEQHSLNYFSGCRNTLSTLEKQWKKLFCLSFNNFIH